MNKPIPSNLNNSDWLDDDVKRAIITIGLFYFGYGAERDMLEQSSDETDISFWEHDKVKTARAAIEAKLAEEVKEARIDELKQLPRYKSDKLLAVTDDYVTKRIKELREQ